MTLNYSRFRSTSSKFFSFVSNNARCFLNTLHVGSSINCGRKRNARRIRTELEKDTWLTAMKKSGGDVKRDRTKCRIEIQRTRKRDNTPDENTGNGGSNGTDPSIARMFMKNFTFSIIGTCTISYPRTRISLLRINKFIVSLLLKLIVNLDN